MALGHVYEGLGGCHDPGSTRDPVILLVENSAPTAYLLSIFSRQYLSHLGVRRSYLVSRLGVIRITPDLPAKYERLTPKKSIY